MGQIKMSTSADVLLELKDIVKKSYIEDMKVIYVRDFLRERMQVFHNIAEQFKGEKIVVRSSASSENKDTASYESHFVSIIDVDSCDSSAVFDAIGQVMASYIENDVSDDSFDSIKDEQILIQRQTAGVVLAGVVYTRDKLYNRPYYVISYDDDGSTDCVKGERGGNTKWIAHNASREFIDIRFLKLLNAVKELEDIFDDVEALDIKFAMDKNEEIVIYHVRPLAAVIGKIPPMSDKGFIDTKAYAKCLYLDVNNILSDSALGNPLEILGRNPRPLDYSLYRELVTERIWSEGISTLGYNRVDNELMQKIGNKPYVSINYICQGLTPNCLSEQLKNKLYSYYEEQLELNKSAHNNIDYEILFSSYNFMTSKRLDGLSEDGFTEEEICQIKEAILNITTNIVEGYSDLCSRDLKSLELLRELRQGIRANSPIHETNIMKLYKYITELVEAIKRNGTPQFTRQSRCAFLANDFCKSLVDSGYFRQEEMEEFLQSIPTVSSEFERDFDRLIHGKMTKKEFDLLYGHLRVCTYDIRTDIYKNMNMDICILDDASYLPKEKKMHLLDENRLEMALRDNNLAISPDDFINFIIETTRNREYFRFEFIKSLSLILDLVIKIGDRLGIAREDMSYLEIQDLLSYHSRDSYIQIIGTRRTIYHANLYLELPDLIYNVGDIDIIDQYY